MPLHKALFPKPGRRPLRQQLAITLTAILTLSILVAVLLLNLLFGWQARELIDQRAAFFMDAMMSVRAYTSKRVSPVVAPLNEGAGLFRPEAVPSYSAQTVAGFLKDDAGYREYSYREAALNPTNLRDKADSFETGVIEAFRSDPSLKRQSGSKATRFNFRSLSPLLKRPRA